MIQQHSTLVFRRRACRRLTRLCVTIGMALFTSVLSVLPGQTQPAQGATTVTGHGVGSMVTWGNAATLWMGAYNTSHGPAFCVDPGGVGPVGKPGKDPSVMKSWTNRQGKAVSADQLAQASALMVWYSENPKTKANAAAVKLALSTILGLTNQEIYGASGLRLNFDVTVSGSPGRQFASRLGILGKTLDLVNYARTHASSWDGTTAEVTHNLTDIRWPGEVLDFSVRLPGVPAGHNIVFVITKPDGSQNRITVPTDHTGRARATYETSEQLPGVYQVQWSISGVPDRYPRAFNGGGTPSQKLMLAGGARSGSGAVLSVALRDGVVSVATKISDQQAVPGSIIRDEVAAQGLVPRVYDQDVVWMVTGVIYRGTPVTLDCEKVDWSASTPVHEFTHQLDNSTIDNAGAVTIALGEFLVPRLEPAYCYTYEVQLTGTVPKDDEEVMIADHDRGEPEETTFVHSDLPDISTQISDQHAGPGSTITDRITISNLHFQDVDGDEVSWSVDGVLIRAASVQGSCTSVDWTQATQVATFGFDLLPDSVDEDGFGEFEGVGPYTIAKAEPSYCYSYGETLVATWASMDTPIRVEHRPGLAPQTTHTISGIKVPTGGVRVGLPRPTVGR